MRWITHYEYQNLQASSDGRVRLTNSEREIRVRKDRGGSYIRFRYQGKVITKTVASVVFEAFHGGPARRGLVICHKNGDCDDNSIQNLVEGDRKYARRSFSRRDESILAEVEDEFDEFCERLAD